MKPLKPSHKENKRYLLIKGKDSEKAKIDEIILEFIGVLGFAEASPMIIKSGREKVVLSINTKSLDKVRASFVLSKKDVKIVKVSGSLKGLGN